LAKRGDMVFYLYQYIHLKNGKSYIGITNNLKRRCQQHISKSNRIGAFNSAVKKYGINAFDFKVLAIFDDKDEAARIEQAAIKSFGTLAPKGYNLRMGAPGTQYAGSLSKETCEKLKILSTGRHSTTKGIPRPPEIRAKISVAQKGKKLSPEHNAKNSSSHKGIIPSEETRQKLSIALKGKSFSPEHCQKIGEANRRRIISPETCQKISAANKGHISPTKGIPRSAETRQKISNVLKGKTKGRPWSMARRIAEIKRKENKPTNNMINKV
jgi:group I intron endonuclease